jgi:GNAT superfamily N-acetyltransferase
MTSEAVSFRPARDDDKYPAYRMFRRSIFAYLHRIGLATAEEAANPPIDSAWKRQSGWIAHFWSTAAENWVAVDGRGEVVGWALSLVRSGHLELAFFFVDPEAGAKGVGKQLLHLAFTSRPERARTIMATQDPSALALYLRSGVHFQSTACDIAVQSQRRSLPADLEFCAVTAGDLDSIAALERDILGLNRMEDLTFLLGNRPGWTAWRAGQMVGYAFGAQSLPEDATDFPPTCGPIGVLDPTDLPGLIDKVIDSAPAATELYFSVPLVNATAVAHLLQLGGKLDPFYLAVLSSDAVMKLDRYVHTAPSFIL